MNTTSISGTVDYIIKDKIFTQRGSLQAARGLVKASFLVQGDSSSYPSFFMGTGYK